MMPDVQDDERTQLPVEILLAETEADAEKAFELFTKTYEPKHPKAAVHLQKDCKNLMAFFDFPVQHWQSILISNQIEFTFRTIRYRPNHSKGVSVS